MADDIAGEPVDWSTRVEGGSSAPTVFRTKSGPPAYWNDEWFFRGVMIALGAALFVSTVGLLWIALCGKTAPQGLVAIASGTIGAFAGALVPSRTGVPHQNDPLE